jgi:ribosome maturation factor RimP
MNLPVEIQARMDEIRAEIEGAGAELIEVIFRRANQQSVLTFLVDKTGGIALEECASLNRKLGVLLDSWGDTSYLLEVNSPGLDRPLKTPKDFGRVMGQTIRVHGHQGLFLNGPVVGKLTAVTELGIELTGREGMCRAVRFEDIVKATREIRWMRK